MKTVEIAKPKTWVKFKTSLCKTCWATCCHDMPVQVSIPDLIRLGFLSEEEAGTALLEAAERLKTKGIIRPFRKNTLIFVLTQKKNKDCLFLDEVRRCTVYENRPEICRQFPKIGPNPSHCPYIEK